MAKRVADKQLTQDTFDEEDEPVEAGFFEQAKTSELKQRVMKKARRSLNSNNSGSSPFAGFLGLSTGPSPFLLSNGRGKSPMSGTSFNAQPKETPPAESTSPSRDPEYFKLLKALNEQFIAWVKQHMAKSSYADFSPVCKDYETHARSLETKYPINSVSKPVTIPTASTTTFSEKEPFSFGLKSNSASIPVSFGLGVSKSSPKNTTSITPFSFKTEVATAAKKGGVEAEMKGNAEDDDYEPPVNDCEPVKEDDAVYSQRCKLFYKKDGAFIEKGLGVLYLKLLNKKTQLLVRANTSIGNILLNVLIDSSITTNRTGKNNVMIICVPNPPLPKIEPVPTPFLIRVKTAEEADQLFSKLEDMRNAS